MSKSTLDAHTHLRQPGQLYDYCYFFIEVFERKGKKERKRTGYFPESKLSAAPKNIYMTKYASQDL